MVVHVHGLVASRVSNLRDRQHEETSLRGIIRRKGKVTTRSVGKFPDCSCEPLLFSPIDNQADRDWRKLEWSRGGRAIATGVQRGCHNRTE